MRRRIQKERQVTRKLLSWMLMFRQIDILGGKLSLNNGGDSNVLFMLNVYIFLFLDVSI